MAAHDRIRLTGLLTEEPRQGLFPFSSIVRSQRWGVARARQKGWKLFFKGGWGIGANVNHQIAFLQRGGDRVALAILTESSPGQRYGRQTLEGVASRLLRGLPRAEPPAGEDNAARRRSIFLQAACFQALSPGGSYGASV